MAERLDKILSSQGAATRREAQRLIRSGKVTVDGTVQRDPSVKVDPETCEIVHSGRTLLYRRHLYVMLNKPAGLLCVSRDPQAATVIDLLPPAAGAFSGRTAGQGHRRAGDYYRRRGFCPSDACTEKGDRQALSGGR